MRRNSANITIEASRSKGVTGTELLRLLETRLEQRRLISLGYASSRREAQVHGQAQPLQRQR